MNTPQAFPNQGQVQDQSQKQPLQQTNQPEQSGRQQGASWILVVIIVFLLSAVGYLAYTNLRLTDKLDDTSTEPQSAETEPSQPLSDTQPQESTGSAVETVEAAESYSEPAGDGVLRYVSPRLGVSFKHQETVQLGQTTQEFEVTETGDKIYIHDSNLVDETGEPILGAKYVEVFDKSPQLTLNQAITNRFNLAANDQCQIEQLQGDFGLEPSYETAVISLVQEPGVEYDLPELMTAVQDNCPTPYTPVGGIAYFMMNPAAAGRMVFVSVGQDCLPSGETGVCWHETIRLFE